MQPPPPSSPPRRTNKYISHSHCLIALDGFLMGCFAYPNSKVISTTHISNLLCFETETVAFEQLKFFYFIFFFVRRGFVGFVLYGFFMAFLWCKRFVSNEAQHLIFSNEMNLFDNMCCWWSGRPCFSCICIWADFMQFIIWQNCHSKTI